MAIELAEETICDDMYQVYINSRYVGQFETTPEVWDALGARTFGACYSVYSKNLDTREFIPF